MNSYVLVFGVVGLLIATAVISFELLVYRLYAEHQLDWLRLGAPPVLFDFTREYGRVVARWTLQKDLIFNTPEWVRRDSRARILVLLFRLSFVFSVASVFGLPIVALLLS